MAESHSIAWRDHSFLICSSADGFLGCFPLPAIVNCATTSIRGQELGTRSGIARSLVILYSTYYGATKLFSTGVAPFTFPPTVDEAQSSFHGWEGHSVIDRGWMAPSTVERREPGSPSFQVLLVPNALGLGTSRGHTQQPNLQVPAWVSSLRVLPIGDCSSRPQHQTDWTCQGTKDPRSTAQRMTDARWWIMRWQVTPPVP